MITLTIIAEPQSNTKDVNLLIDVDNFFFKKKKKNIKIEINSYIIKIILHIIFNDDITYYFQRILTLSMTPISALNLFKIFPIGLQSKNEIGAPRSPAIASWCNLRLALAPAHCPATLYKNDKKIEPTDMMMYILK